MQTELAQLKRQLTLLKMYAFTSGVLMLSFALFSLTGAQKDVIRAKGIVIVDAQGRDRILIGAPIPDSKDRMRTNLERVKKEWAPGMPKQYMEWYRKYDHSANGIVFLNERGIDKVVVGETMPDPNTGKRMVKSAGMTFNDDQGYERGGIGVSVTKEGKTRTAIGLDDEDGEAVHLFALEDGTKGLRISHKDGHLFYGNAEPNSMFANGNEKVVGALTVGTDGKLGWTQNTLKK